VGERDWGCSSGLNPFTSVKNQVLLMQNNGQTNSPCLLHDLNL
jgi:hypothetical protein